jgi:hypothetical protein
VVHGAYCPAIVNPAAAQVLAELAADPDVGYLADPKYRRQASRFARMAAMEERISAHLDTLTDEELLEPTKGGGNTKIESWRAIAEAANRSASRLGLDPLARSRMGREVAGTRFDLARAWAAEDAAENGAQDAAERAVEPQREVPGTTD